jgi:acyl dehydratase
MTGISKTEKIYIDDVQIGDTFRSDEHLIDAQQIREFAQQFDPQPFHLDEDAAKDSFFNGLAASGWHTAAITMKLLVDSVRLAGGVIGAGGEVSWPQPTRPGDVLHVESTVLSITPSKSKPDRGIVVVQSDTLNQRGELCQRMVAKLLAFKRTSPIAGNGDV